MIGSPLFKNTATNYLVVGARLLQGLLVTRWLWNYLGEAGYGLWSLLWAIFAYALLLDFGFGVSAQKYTAAGLWKTDVGKYNRIISAIFSFHVLMALPLLIGTGIGAFYIGEITRVSDPEKLAYCRTAFLLFGGGAALAFPTGIFPEMLTGLHKLYSRNYVNAATKLTELAATYIIIRSGGGVISLVFLAIGLWLGANWTMALLLRRDISGWRLVFNFDPTIWKEIVDFSFFAYLTGIARLVLDRGNVIIVSCFFGLTGAGVFNLSGRLSDLCLQFSSQYQENIRPVTATLHARKENNKLKIFIFDSIIINCFFGMFLMLPAYIFIDEALAVLFKADQPQVFSLGRWFLVLAMANLVFRQAAQSFLLMGGRHRLLSLAIVIEASVNLGVVLMLLGVFAGPLQFVVYSALAVSVAVSCFWLLPVTFRQLGISGWNAVFKGYFLPLASGIIPAVLGWFFKLEFGTALGDFLTAALGSILVSVSYTIIFFFVALPAPYRRMILRKIRAKIHSTT